MAVDGHECLNFFLGFQVRVVIMLRHHTGDGVLPFRGDKQNGALQPGQHREEQVEQDVGVGIPSLRCQNQSINSGLDDHEADETSDEGPASHPVPHEVGGSLAFGQRVFMLLVPSLVFISHGST